jgi:hypothetical protein
MAACITKRLNQRSAGAGGGVSTSIAIEAFE